MENKPDTQLPVEREAAKWNPNDKERDATTYAGIVVALMGSAIKNLSTGCNYDAIELDVRSSIYYFQKLVEIILPAEQAIPLHQLQQENAKLKEQAAGWRPLLEDALKVTKDKYLYYRIKKFLYGE
jgi:hypothetical protein